MTYIAQVQNMKMLRRIDVGMKSLKRLFLSPFWKKITIEGSIR